MKFSYSVIEKFVKPKSKEHLVESLLMKAFEAEHVSADTFNAEIPHNRYADAASHLGVAREYAAITGKTLKEPAAKDAFSKKSGIEVKVEDAKLCSRYAAAEFTLPKRGITPAWMKKALESCGLRAIHPAVDVLNYVMLEVGQPLHAFDKDKLKGGIVVRAAKPKERLTTIDNQTFVLEKDMLVIADKERAQALAGMKGGKPSEVKADTKHIVVEAANFDSVSVYRTSRALGLATDASARFAHGMSPHSVGIGLGRARALLEEILGAQYVGAVDVYPKPAGREIIGVSVEKTNRLIGAEIKKSEMVQFLERLGFTILPSKKKGFDFLVEVPPLRLDVTIPEDVVEEITRLYGMNELKAKPPVVSLTQAKEEESIAFKERIREVLTAAGFTEVYNYSYGEERTDTSYELQNPIADNKKFLRHELTPGLLQNLETNSRFFDDIRLFELGNVFDRKKSERLFLGVAIKSKAEDPFLALKGVVEGMLHRLGVVEFDFVPAGVDLEVRAEGEVLGAIRIAGRESAVAQFDASRLLRLVEGEYEYREIPKYPSVMRDISLEMQKDTKVGDILNAIQAANAKHVRDVDLIDYYDPRHFTFRIIFQSEERTLKDKEVNDELTNIAKFLKSKFGLKIR